MGDMQAGWLAGWLAGSLAGWHALWVHCQRCLSVGKRCRTTAQFQPRRCPARLMGGFRAFGMVDRKQGARGEGWWGQRRTYGGGGDSGSGGSAPVPKEQVQLRRVLQPIAHSQGRAVVPSSRLVVSSGKSSVASPPQVGHLLPGLRHCSCTLTGTHSSTTNQAPSLRSKFAFFPCAKWEPSALPFNSSQLRHELGWGVCRLSPG